MSAIDDLVGELSRLPTIGRKSALRLVYHLLRQPRDQSRRLARALEVVADQVHPCPVCANFTEADRCDICTDARRDGTLLCVVEEASDIPVIERSGEFRGRYHVLGGRLAPLDGVGPEELTVEALLARVRTGEVAEVILATSPKVEGDATAVYLEQQLRPSGVRVTRLARGLPVGGELEYADGGTIAQALSARRGLAPD